LGAAKKPQPPTQPTIEEQCVTTEFPITVTGELRPRRLDTNIGSGGPLIHLTTHNGQVLLKRTGTQ
jgi:hypothetical protein